MKPEELLEAQSAEWGIQLHRSQVDALRRYALLLSEYEKARVIGTRGFSGILLEHVLDSLSCFLVPEIAGVRTLVDVGSGAGLPAIPIKLVSAGTRVTLVESVAKKVSFLEYAVRKGGMEGISLVHARAEDYGNESQVRATYRVAVTRAVASLPVIAEYCLPLVSVGGIAVAMKGNIQADEFDAGKRAADMLGARITNVLKVPFIHDLPQKERHLVVMEKVKETPKQYPRQAGRPTKRPLGTSR